MHGTQVSVTLPDDVAARMRARVASGQYASESEVVREALDEFDDKDRIYEERLERWLRTEGVAAYEAWKANPDDVFTVDEVREHLRARREREDRQG